MLALQASLSNSPESAITWNVFVRIDFGAIIPNVQKSEDFKRLEFELKQSRDEIAALQKRIKALVQRRIKPEEPPKPNPRPKA